MPDLTQLDFRKKITNPFQLSQIQILAKSWGICAQDACWRLITDGIIREKNKREEIEELKKQNNKH